MRQIKFIAWDHEEKEIVPVIKMSGDGSSICVRNVRGEEYWQEVGTFDLMQYANLDDKNGKEIFEGDIVSYSSYYIGDVYYSKGIGIIKFDNGGFYIDENALAPELCSEEISNCGIEIIGNKFENPELVKENESIR